MDSQQWRYISLIRMLTRNLELLDSAKGRKSRGIAHHASYRTRAMYKYSRSHFELRVLQLLVMSPTSLVPILLLNRAEGILCVNGLAGVCCFVSGIRALQSKLQPWVIGVATIVVRNVEKLVGN